jgi:hypothetical protein
MILFIVVYNQIDFKLVLSTRSQNRYLKSPDFLTCVTKIFKHLNVYFEALYSYHNIFFIVCQFWAELAAVRASCTNAG